MLSRIDEEMPALSLIVNQSITGMIAISQKEAHFYQFNNCINPVFESV